MINQLSDIFKLVVASSLGYIDIMSTPKLLELYPFRFHEYALMQCFSTVHEHENHLGYFLKTFGAWSPSSESLI